MSLSMEVQQGECLSVPGSNEYKAMLREIGQGVSSSMCGDDSGCRREVHVDVAEGFAVVDCVLYGAETGTPRNWGDWLYAPQSEVEDIIEVYGVDLYREGIEESLPWDEVEIVERIANELL